LTGINHSGVHVKFVHFRRIIAVRSRYVLAALTALLLVPLVPLTADAAVSRINLTVLVVSNGDPSVEAIATQLDREGVPYTKVNLGDAGRPVIDAAFLEDAAAGIGKFQAVVLPNQAGGGLGAAEVNALTAYEQSYGVRQVNSYDYPGASMGLSSPLYAGSLDAGAATVTAAGTSGALSYLRGSFAIDDFAPGLEVYGYLASPSTTLPAGHTFTSLVTVAAGGTSGTLIGSYAHDGREELVLTAAYNPSMQWFNQVAPGIVSWVTRGIHLGHQRQYLAVQIDDVFLPDSRWSISGKCTPGDDCVDPTITTPDIRMSTTDVTRLVDWQNANGFDMDMVFNGGGSEAAKAENGGVDPLTDSFLAVKGEFPWINHTYTHPFLGCIQIAPTVVGEKWHCATQADEQPRQDPEVPQEPSGGIYWASQSYITSQVQDNITWATTNALPNFDATELVTGEHSGLLTLPLQPTDNPFLAPALTATGVQWTASDASREANSRTVGTTQTVPRHPMNIYYNTATYREQISEYNWYYTSRANGGSGICEDFPEVTTCITPLEDDSDAEARASFDSYLQPIEERNALGFVLANDPRPFYAHQSNLAEDGILYPVVEGVIDHYTSVYDAVKAPLVHLGLGEQGLALTRMTAWKSAAPTVSAYIDGSGVHLPASGSTAAPLTVPTGTTVTGTTLESYAGALSGWTSGAAVTAVPPTPWGGYGPVATAPGAPTIGTATAGTASATVTWSSPASTGGSAITGYTVRAYVGTGTTVVASATAAASASSATVAGLTNGTAYTFDVVATNAVGTSPPSARSNSVTPAAATVPGVPTNVVATPGNASATVTWTPPTNNGGSAVTGYRVRAYVGTSNTAVKTVAAGATATSLVVTGLTNGSSYTFAVYATNAIGNSPFSTRSNAVTPAAATTVPGAPTNVAATAGNASATVTWTPPASNGGSAITGYQVRAYVGTGNTIVKTVPAGATATSLVVTGLTNGSSYSFAVYATNAVGNSPFSARSNAVTPTVTTTVPGAPTNVSAIAGNASATVTWTPPASNGGSAITGYRVRAYVGTSNTAVKTVSAGATATSIVVTGLTNGSSYSFAVFATNAVGNGPFSTRSAAVTPG